MFVQINCVIVEDGNKTARRFIRESCKVKPDTITRSINVGVMNYGI